MTTPTDDQRSPWPAPEVPQVGLRGRFTSEVMAGGAVVERADDELVGGFRGGAGVAVIVALFAMLGFFSIWWLVFAVGLLVSVFLHELGHFATARWTGMKATQFFIGFGPRVWSFRRGETEYGVRALPLGAFVRIVGMNMMDDVEPPEEGRAYRSKSYPRRLLVISAGSIMHMVIALVLLSGVYTLSGQSVLGDGAEVRAVSEGLPAEVGGVLPGDVILSVGGVEVIEGAPLGEAIVSHSPGDSVDVVVDRDGALLSLPVTLGSYELVGGPDDVAFLGVSSSPLVDVVKRSWWSSPVYATSSMVSSVGDSVVGVLRVLNPVNVLSHLSGESDDLATRPTTLVGITSVSDDVGEVAGLAGVLELLALLNVFVGVFNMFPLLPLDGGHALVATYERARERGGRRYHADVEKLMPLTMAVVTVLLFLFVSGLYLDIVRPVG